MTLRKKAFRTAERALDAVARNRSLLSYKMGGRKAWTRGYFEHKWREVGEALGDTKILAAFRDGGVLPEKFGAGIDERIVEYPWLLSHLPSGSGKLLDAGSALNFEAVLSQRAFAEKRITIANLNPEPNCFWKRGVSYVFEDIRSLPFLPETFDFATCISTLEHVGMDNAGTYTKDGSFKESAKEDYLLTLKELKRILKPGGTLFLTVPFGKYSDFGWFQQFDSAMLKKAVEAFSPSKSAVTFYKYEKGGWQPSTKERCTDAEYATADRAREDASLPASAEAVACLMLTK